MSEQRSLRKEKVSITVDVVIPVLNEAHVLENSTHTVCRFLAKHMPCSWCVTIVDNGSTDGTDQIGERLSTEIDHVNFLRLELAGRGRALRHSWGQSKSDIVCYTDVDLSTDLTYLPRMISAIADEGYDIAVGSRLMKDSYTKRSFKREVISRLYNVFVKMVLSVRFSDAQCGFKAVSRTVVEHIVPQIEDESWFFDTELLVLAEKQGYRIKEIPVKWIESDDSRVKIIRTAWDDIRGVFRVRRRLWKLHRGVSPVKSQES